jgi:hypothetical protein
MKIKNRFTGNVLCEHEGPLARANLTGANLRWANLTEANLTEANLTGANLTGANLRGANLTEANLTEANLTEANLTEATLTEANLTEANLTGANLRGANLTGATLPNSETYEDFIAAMPRLLTAGGKTVDEVAQHWGCHLWENCPMHAAFGASSLGEVPVEWRERAELFVNLFDSGTLPCPL